MAETGEILRTTARYSAPASSQMQNIFHHQVVGASVDDLEAANTINNWMTNDWAVDWAESAALSAELEDISVDVVNVDGTVVRAIAVYLIQQTGLLPSPVLPAANAAYILLKTIVPKIRGIKYIPGFSETAVDDGEWTSAAIVDMGFLLLDYAKTLEPMGAAELIPGVPAPSIGVFEPFLDTGILETIPAYQRRRKPGVGI